MVELTTEQKALLVKISMDRVGAAAFSGMIFNAKNQYELQGKAVDIDDLIRDALTIRMRVAELAGVQL